MDSVPHDQVRSCIARYSGLQPCRIARSDRGSAFGDWETVAELAASAPERVDCDVLAAPRSAERDPVGCRDVECLAMATAEGPALDVVAALANSSCQQAVGNDVTFVVNRNINRTNICYPGRRFCGSAQRKGDADGDTLSCCDAQPSSRTNFGARTSLAATS